MNDLPIDNIKATMNKWSTELTAALNHAGFGVQFSHHTGSSSVRLGKLTVTQPGCDVHYVIDFERKMTVKKGVRTLLTQLEVYNPVGGLHVHILNFSDETVAKIVGYAKRHIEVKHAQEQESLARSRRSAAGQEIYRREMEGFPMPGWARAMPNVNSDAEVGTFRVIFHEHSAEWPLNRLTPAQVKQVVDAMRAVTCSHKFVDSKCCLKCGWTPPVDPPAPNFDWRIGTVPVPPELVNDPNSITGEFKMLLLVVSTNQNPVRGWYYGGLLKQFMMEGSPSEITPLFWMPMPISPISSSPSKNENL